MQKIREESDKNIRATLPVYTKFRSSVRNFQQQQVKIKHHQKKWKEFIKEAKTTRREPFNHLNTQRENVLIQLSCSTLSIYKFTPHKVKFNLSLSFLWRDESKRKTR